MTIYNWDYGNFESYQDSFTATGKLIQNIFSTKSDATVSTQKSMSSKHTTVDNKF